MDLKYFKNQGDGVFDILLTGIVGEKLDGDEIAKEIKFLNEIGAKVIKEHINSVGGSLINGLSIVSANLNSKAEIQTINEGMAGSIMSVILSSGSPGKRFGLDFSTAVIHDLSFDGVMLEEIEDEKLKSEAKKLKESLVQIYANNTKLTKSQARKMMTADTMLNATEQKNIGLIDEILPSKMKPVITKNMSYADIMNICRDKSKFQNVFNGDSSKTTDNEPQWVTVDKRKLPREAFAEDRPDNPSEWGFPHHFIKDGKIDEETERFETGTMFLHKGGLNAAWAAAQGARTGQEADQFIINHLAKHRKDLGLDNNNQNSKKMSNLTKFYNLSDEANEAAILEEAQKDRSKLELTETKVTSLEKSGGKKDTEIADLKKEVDKFRNEAIESSVEAAIKAGKYTEDKKESLIENAKNIGLEAFNAFTESMAATPVDILNQIKEKGTSGGEGEKKSKEQKLAEEWQELITNNKPEAQRIKHEEPKRFEAYTEAWNKF